MSPRHRGHFTKEFIYKCHCGFEVFRSENIFYHQPVKNEKLLCNAHFIEKMKWMNFDALSSIYKLVCRECKAVLGDAKVSGLMCSCGYWQIPAFKIYKNKTTEILVKNKTQPNNNKDDSMTEK